MINIASVTDSDFADVLMTNLVSILENNLDSNFQFFIINDKLTQDNINYFNQLRNIYANIKNISFIQVDTNPYKKANINSPGTAIKENIYYKIELSFKLPVSRLLYLDTDMICIRNITGLWGANLHNNVIGAVQDTDYKVIKNFFNDLYILHKTNQYFNAGMLLFDCKKWNLNHLTQKIRQFIKEKGKSLVHQYQDALNIVLNGNWQILNPKYDVQSSLAKEHQTDTNSQLKKLQQAPFQKPTIIHYCSWYKPWVRTGRWIHPFRTQYFWYKYIATQRLHDYAFNQKIANQEKPVN